MDFFYWVHLKFSHKSKLYKNPLQNTLFAHFYKKSFCLMHKSETSGLLTQHWNTEGPVRAGILPKVSKAP